MSLAGGVSPSRTASSASPPAGGKSSAARCDDVAAEKNNEEDSRSWPVNGSDAVNGGWSTTRERAKHGDDLSPASDASSAGVAGADASAAAAVTGARASVATQTNTDLLGRYFHRRSKPVSSFLGAGARHGSRSKSSRMTSAKSTALNNWSTSSSCGGANSAYQFGGSSTSSSGSTLIHAGSSSSPSVNGGSAVLQLTSMAPPLIMPAVNGKTTFLITVPANFTLPPAVAGPVASVAAAGKASSRGVVQGRTSARLTAVSSTATALVLQGGSGALGTPLQLLVAAASALNASTSTTTSTSSSAHAGPLTASPAVCSTLQNPAALTQQSTAVATIAQTSRRDVTGIGSHVTGSVGHVISTVSHHQQQQQQQQPVGGTVVRAVTSTTPGAGGCRLVTPLPPVSALRTSTAGLHVSAAMTLPTGSPLMTTRGPAAATVSPGPSPSLACSGSPVSAGTPRGAAAMTSPPGARHVTIASLPRVAAPSATAVRRRCDGVRGSSPVLNGAARPAPAASVLPPRSRHEPARSPAVGGTAAKQPGAAPPASIIRAILERNLTSCPTSYHVDELALTPSTANGVHEDGCGTAGTDIQQTLERGTCTGSLAIQSRPLATTVSADCTDGQTENSVGCPVGGGSSKRTAFSVYQASASAVTASKQRRGATDACTTAAARPASDRTTSQTPADPVPLPQPPPHGTSTSSLSRYSPPAASATTSAAESGAVGSSLPVVSTSGLITTSGIQQTGSSYAAAERHGDPAGGSCPQVLERSAAARALPKKVYAYLGSAGAAASAQLSSFPPANSAGRQRASQTDLHDGPINHLRLMCSGLSEVCTHGGAAM